MAISFDSVAVWADDPHACEARLTIWVSPAEINNFARVLQPRKISLLCAEITGKCPLSRSSRSGPSPQRLLRSCGDRWPNGYVGRNLAGSGRAAIGNRNVEAELRSCTASLLLSIQYYY